jgi:nitrogen fixation protein FixH
MKLRRIKMINWIKDHILESILLLIATVITVFIIIAVCVNESHRISEGTVVDHHYTSGYATGKPLVYHPPKYTLTISGMKDGEEVEYTFEVPEGEYVKYNIGDHYPKED